MSLPTNSTPTIAASTATSDTTPIDVNSSKTETHPPPSVPSKPSLAVVLSDYHAKTQRRVLMGTCGWNDASIGRCGRFYPSQIRTAVERLRHYSTHFPCVEVDTSNYAIPSVYRIQEWMAQTPPTFKFHFKIFGMITAQNIVYNAIPNTIRHLITPAQIKHDKVHMKDVSDGFKSALWSLWNQTLSECHKAGKLGLVVFQFHLGFTPTEENKQYVRWCRECLDPEYQMAIEFRSRSWFHSSDQTKFTDEDFLNKTVKFARSINCALIAEDDLEHEVTGRFVPLAPGQLPRRLPIHLRVAAPHSLYIRLHRRQGAHRVLADEEFVEWARRFHDARSTADVELQGPIYYLIGTDHEDQPVINSKKMMAALEAFDNEQQRKYEEQLKSSSSDTSAAASTTVSSPAASSSSTVPLLPPEPLAFNYPKYFKQVISRLPNVSHSTASAASAQLSLGSFFSHHTNGTTQLTNSDVTEKAQDTKPKQPSIASSFTAAATNPLNSITLPAALPMSPVSDASFVLASTLPLEARSVSPPTLPHAPGGPVVRTNSIKAAFLSQLASPKRPPTSVSRPTTGGATASATSTPAAPPSTSTQLRPPPPSDIDAAAEVAAIEAAYRELESKSQHRQTNPIESKDDHQMADVIELSSTIAASPAKRKLPYQSVGSPSPAKKSKKGAPHSTSTSSASQSIQAFFKKL